MRRTNSEKAQDRSIVALDVATEQEALQLVSELDGHVLAKMAADLTGAGIVRFITGDVRALRVKVRGDSNVVVAGGDMSINSINKVTITGAKSPKKAP